MKPAPFPPDLPLDQRAVLDDLVHALAQLDRAFGALTEDNFARLPKPYRVAANIVLVVLRDERLS